MTKGWSRVVREMRLLPTSAKRRQMWGTKLHAFSLRGDDGEGDERERGDEGYAVSGAFAEGP